MLPSDLLMYRYRGADLIPKRLPLDKKHVALASELIELFGGSVGEPRLELDERLQGLEGTDTDYRVNAGWRICFSPLPTLIR